MDKSGEVFDDLAQWMAGHTGSACQLVLSGTLTHQLVLRDNDLPLHDVASLTRYARQQFQLVHGSAAERWPMAVWSEWPQQAACALHGLELAALQQLARRHAVRLRRVQPWWSLAWRHAQRNAAWAERPRRALLLVEGQLATWIVGDPQGLQSVQQRRLAQPALADIAGLLCQLQGDDQFDADSTLVAGIGVEPDAAGTTRLPAQVAPGLHAAHPAAAWITS
jgi:hypothetical protein